MRTRFRLAVRAAVAALLATAAMLVPAGAAHAADGSGWSWHWHVDNENWVSFGGTLPGLRLSGGATIQNDIRRAHLTLEDTVADGQCANVFLKPDRGWNASLRVCDGETTSFVSSLYTGTLAVSMSRTDAIGFPYQYYNATVPPISRAGSTAWWAYTAADRATFGMRNSFALIDGLAVHDAEHNWRTVTVNYAVTGDNECAWAEVRGWPVAA